MGSALWIRTFAWAAAIAAACGCGRPASTRHKVYLSMSYIGNDWQGVDDDAMERQYLSMISLRNMVTPEDVAATGLFLCSPAGRNTSGQVLSGCGHVETS